MSIVDPYRSMQDALSGTPYSLDIQNDENSIDVLEDRLHALINRSTDLRLAYRHRSSEPIKSVQRVTEIYESNAIEGLGCNLPATYKVMQRGAKRNPVDVQRYTLMASLTQDPHVAEVMSLQTARELVDTLVEDRTAPLTESDLRSIHSLVLGEHSAAGRYKRYVNSM
jgi:hypothetical protein